MSWPARVARRTASVYDWPYEFINATAGGRYLLEMCTAHLEVKRPAGRRAQRVIQQVGNEVNRRLNFRCLQKGLHLGNKSASRRYRRGVIVCLSGVCYRTGLSGGKLGRIQRLRAD